MEPKQTVCWVGRREATEADARIQEICDQLHRLEALVAVTVIVPTPSGEGGATNRPFVFFREPFEPTPSRRC